MSGDWFSHRRCSVCGKFLARPVNKEIHEQYVHGIDHGRERNGTRKMKVKSEHDDKI